MKSRTARVCRRALCLVLCVCLCLLGTSCGGGQQQETAYSRDFLGELSPAEFIYYVAETFYTLLPHLDSPAELGISNLQYSVGGTGEVYEGLEYDTLREINGSYDIILKSMPVFYGLLKTAEQYEEYMGIDNSEAARQHGKKHAIKASSVEEALHNLMCKPSLLTHGSADGAEYVDGYYVYDELINPYQQWLDQGWELQFIPTFTEAEQPHYNWGEEQVVSDRYIPMWYSPDGTLYDVYGEKLTVLDDPAFRFDNSFQYEKWMKEQVFNAGISFEGMVDIGIVDMDALEQDEDAKVEWNTKISSVSVGSLLTGVG